LRYSRYCEINKLSFYKCWDSNCSQQRLNHCSVRIHSLSKYFLLHWCNLTPIVFSVIVIVNSIPRQYSCNDIPPPHTSTDVCFRPTTPLFLFLLYFILFKHIRFKPLKVKFLYLDLTYFYNTTVQYYKL